MTVHSLSDKTIGQLAKLLQLAILSGTDVVDHLRMLKLVSHDGSLELEEAYEINFNDNLQSMLSAIEGKNESGSGNEKKLFN
jgi:hypothetical protein